MNELASLARSLARLIVVKEQLDRTKDQAMIVQLRATLEELQKRR